MIERAGRDLTAAALAVLAAGLVAPSIAAGQGVLWVMQGNSSVNGIGVGSAAIGDIDGDGLSEIATTVGVDAANGGQSSARVVSSQDPNSVLYIVPSQVLQMASAGDVNSDGAPDWLAVHVCGSDVRIVSGPTGQTLVKIVGGSNCSLISSIDGIADFNGDGNVDIAIGRPQQPGGSRVDVYTTSGALLKSFASFPTAATNFGAEICSLGDIDADGYSDFGVGQGAPNALALLHGGATGSTMTTSSHAIGTMHSNVMEVASLDDLDGDGRPELAVSLDSEIQIISSVTWLPSMKLGANDAFGDGIEVEALGDQDGDGYRDLLTTRYWPSWGIDLWSGATGAKLLHAGDTNFFGMSIDGAGDFDGDGREDVVIGSPAGSPPGQVAVMSVSTLQCGSATPHGAPCASPGSGPPTSIAASGCFTPGAPVQLEFTKSGSGSLHMDFFVLVGTQPASLTIPGSLCRLLVGPQPLALLGPVPIEFSNSKALVPFTMPLGIAAPATFEIQAAFLPPGLAVHQFTNGLRIDVR